MLLYIVLSIALLAIGWAAWRFFAPKAPQLEAIKAPTPMLQPLPLALKETRSGFTDRLWNLLTGRAEISQETMGEIEALLFSADIGVQTAHKLIDRVQNLALKEKQSGNAIIENLQKEVLEILQSVPSGPLVINGVTPHVVMFVGVNGVGKTTTIGKIASLLKAQGKKVVLGAGDTFRAAAVEQLAVWAERNDVPIVKGDNGADSASVLFDAINKAKTDGADVVLCDTAGRLHTKTDLMDELKKVYRVLGKASPGAPQDVLLVLDATTGQNAIVQAQQFAAATPLTGVVLTKLDGTAKGGVVIGIVDALKLPVRYIGVGEKKEDLRPFDAEAFVAALFEHHEEGRAI